MTSLTSLPYDVTNLPLLCCSIVVYHLFSQGPPTLLLPHVLDGIAAINYCRAMDTLSEKEILTQARQALDAYAHNVMVGFRGMTRLGPV